MKKLLLLFALLFFALLAASAWVWKDYQQFLEQPLTVPEQGLSIEIPRGSSYAAMVEQLIEVGVTEKRWPWRLLNRLKAQLIQAGEYRLEPGVSPQLWLDKLAKGEVIRHNFTIIEGWKVSDLLKALAADKRLKQTLSATDSKQQLLSLLPIEDANPEGWFLPETYSFIGGDSDLDILTQAYNSMQKILAQQWQLRQKDLPISSPYEMLILASIVEKETAVAEERGQIAGVFVRRLQKRMRLQTDPTVIYGIGESFDGDIKRKDLRTDTPYNTYTRHGLPPTPIALPGAASIHAVSQPEAGESLYFVADGSGGHTFSTTYAEHNKAVQKMLKRK